MDDIDRAIVAELERDARVSNVDLADRVGLTPSPTLRRVRALEETGVITGYHARIDPEHVGLGFRVLVWVDLVKSTSDAIEAFEVAVLGIDEVAQAHRLYGEPDYLLQVAVRDADAYERLYTTRLAALPGIQRAVSQIAMKTVKAPGSPPRGVTGGGRGQRPASAPAG